MLVAFRERSQDAQALALLFLSSVGGQPQWAILDAASRFTLGQVPRNTQAFAPTVAEFLVEIRRLVDEDAEHKRLQAPPKMLPPPNEPSPLERARMAKKLAGLVKDMKDSADEEKAKDKAKHLAQVGRANEINAQRIVEEAEAAGIEPFADAEKKLPVSLALRRLLKQQVEDDEFLNAAFEAAKRRLDAQESA